MSKSWNKNNITQRPMIKINNNILSDKQLNALKNSTSLPVSIIRSFHEFLDMKVLTNTTPIQKIINNKFLPWDMSVIIHKKDIRMIHTQHFNINWDYYKLTIEEPDVCNIARNPHLNWDPAAIELISIYKYCDEHLLFIIKKYNKINWNWKLLTIKLNLEDILKNISLPWCYIIIMEKLLKIDIKSELFISILFNVNHTKLNWKKISDYVSWDFISNFQSLPWVYVDKDICQCEKINCNNCLDLYNMKKLKSKPLDWKKITNITSYLTIYSNPEIPWDEETIIKFKHDPPLWFIEKTNYKWDMKEITKKSKWEDIYKNRNIKWDLDEFVIFSDIIPTIDILCQYPNLKWDWDKLSQLCLFNDIITHTTFPWNFEIIKKRNNIPFKFILTFPEKNWMDSNIIKYDKYEEKFMAMYKLLNTVFTQELSFLVLNKIY